MKYSCHYLVADLETGGYEPTENPILEVAIVCLDSISLKEQWTYHTLIKPYDIILSNGDIKKPIITASALKVNGIDVKEATEKGLDLETFYKELKECFKKATLGKVKPRFVGQNFGFDLKYLSYIFQHHFKDDIYNYVERHFEDILFYSRNKWGNEDVTTHQLKDIAERLGIEVFDLHGALNDTKFTAEIFKTFVKNQRSEFVVGESDKIVKKFREFQI